jgi:hypothetical protein
MSSDNDKPVLAVAGPDDGDREALFRRAAKVTRTSHLLINETEQLLAQTRKLLKRSEDRLIPK